MVVLVMENSLHSFQQATLFLQGNWCPVYRDTPGRGFVKLPAMSGVLDQVVRGKQGLRLHSMNSGPHGFTRATRTYLCRQ